MPRSTSRAVLCGGMLCLATSAGAEPARADDAPLATASSVGVKTTRLDVTVGSRLAVSGRVGPSGPQLAGYTVVLQIRRGGRWVALDRDRTGPAGRYALRKRVRAPMSTVARVRLSGHGAVLRRAVGRANVYRAALASWYGPGLYGNRLGCGGRLGAGTLGVAHKSLPCGTALTLRHGRRSIRVRVIDRGPYVGAREFDLTAATARALRFSGHGLILVTR